MKVLVKNIKALLRAVDQMPKNPLKGQEMQELPILQGRNVLIEDGLISGFPDSNEKIAADKEIDAARGYVLPGFVDSHTHIVFAESREAEFVMKIKGKSYVEIAKEGGGILNSARKLAETSEDDLCESTKKRLEEVISMGTTAIEIKSGYGLSTESEIKMLRVIKRLKQISPIPIKATFLGAHAFPAEYRDNHEAYIDMIINEMLPIIKNEDLADYIDVFCDEGFFSESETDQILEAGAKLGLKAKIHANELGFTGGIQSGVRNDALSVDHLEFTGDDEIQALKNSKTMPTLLPGTAFYLGMEYPPARKMIDSGLPIALASDYNPGSCPSGNMSFIASLACIKMKLLPNEAINALTVNGAHAMELHESAGSLAPGTPANLIITNEIPSLEFMPYSFGSRLINKVLLKGEIFEGLE